MKMNKEGGTLVAENSTLIEPVVFGGGNDDDLYHHHAKITDALRMLTLVHSEELVGLCGARRKPLVNPVDHPCCPRCAELMGSPCGYGPN